MSEPNTKPTSHQSLTSNAGRPIPATCWEWVTHRFGALTEATAAVIHLTIFRAGTDAKTLSGQLSTPPWRQTVPPPCVRPPRHVQRRDPAAPCRRDPPPSTREKARNTTHASSIRRRSTNNAPNREHDTAAPPSSDPMILGFLPEWDEQVDDAFIKITT